MALWHWVHSILRMACIQLKIIEKIIVDSANWLIDLATQSLYPTGCKLDILDADSFMLWLCVNIHLYTYF